jgi:hypothetical protein
MGKGGSLDNETAGGIVCSVRSDGKLHDYAVDRFGTKFVTHPDSGLRFSDLEPVPHLRSLRTFACDMAQHLYLTRLASFDICLDINENWRAIEYNLFGQTIRFSQYAGNPFFGPFTSEVIDYCQKASRLNLILRS